MGLSIHPSVGVARLGNSHGQFYLAPDKIGGLPFEADQHGNQLGTINNFKDAAGLVRRQGQPFKIYQDGVELTLDSPNVESIEWTVHLANKKAAWYQYSELQGNLLYPNNSYAENDVPFRNDSIKGETERQKLIIDPGPRVISGRQQFVSFEEGTPPVPASYPTSYSPQNPEYGTGVETLGELVTDDQGRLVVLGGYGNAGGDEPLTSYGGSDTWHDDISDGPVYCTVTLTGGQVVELQAWCIVGSPDFAPEIVNISTLSDTMFDVGVRCFDLVPDMCENGTFKDSYQANFQRDILPIIQRIGAYQWVSNVQSMMAFTSNIFDFSDKSASNRANRENYFSYFRAPDDKQNTSPDQPQQQLMKESGSDFFPMMPLNSGSNSVSNQTIEKFLALNETQYFLLGQWAKGEFDADPSYTPYPINSMDEASVGNCVGLPMCPGIEVTWSMQNDQIYTAPYVIHDQMGKGGYDTTGLTPSRDECEGGGCQPGDLTKRMACPWQADFFQCTIQYVNFTDPAVNKVDGTPLPPTYYTYWWPPQSPWDVLTGEMTAAGQAASHLPAGQQMNYARGINSFVQMVENWYALAFIRNANSGDTGYPYFTEVERTNEVFSYQSVGVGTITGNDEDNETTIPVFYVESDTDKVAAKGLRATKLMAALERRAFKKIKVHPDGLGMPRSGTRTRR